MSYDALFHHELRAAREQGFKARDANTVARQRARLTADYLRRYWVFQPPTPSELAEVARLEAIERAEQEQRRA